jgi:hypothetical protein
MSLFNSRKKQLISKKNHLKELSRNSSFDYYWRHRDEILKKRRKRYRETGF